MDAKKVFISYAHETDFHNEKVFELSERLRSEGIDCSIDQYEISPREGWPRWSRNQIKHADFVLVICTETYERRFEGSESRGTGAGAKWEGAIITQELYNSEGNNTKFIPIVFDSNDVKHIPTEMRGGTYYILNSETEYDDLYRHLTNQPKAVKRELGRLRSLPVRSRKETFTSNEPNNEAPSSTTTSKSKPQLPLAVLWPVGKTAVFVRMERIRTAGKQVSLSIVPSTSRQASAIVELERSREPIGLAYNETALMVRMRSLEKIIEQGREVWHLEFEIDEHAMSDSIFEMNISSFSAEQIAELRARRILLDEKLSQSLGMRPNDLTTQLIENSVAGGSNHGFAIMGSPFPGLFEQLKEDVSEFLEAARVSAVLLLLLTHTVYQIDRLDMTMHSATELRIHFNGTRPPRYSRESPQQIDVEGICSLVS